MMLPYPGDPFLINYWLLYYEKIWHEEIDRLIVVFNSPIEKSVSDYIVDRIARAPKTTTLVIEEQIEHGEAINRGLDEVETEYVGLIEDDAFVLQPGMIHFAFSGVEQKEVDVVGSRRASCSQEIIDRADELWDIKDTPYGDNGPNFWPCYFFTKTAILRATTRRFGARAWNKGDLIGPLQHVVEAPVVNGDTFVSTSLELRATIPEDRIRYLPQYHLHPDDERDAQNNTGIFNKNPEWVHVGSLSSGVSGVLRDDQNRPLARRKIDPPGGETVLEKYANTEMEKKEWERRVAFWLTFWEYREPDKIIEFSNAYKEAIDRVIYQYKLNTKSIFRIKKIYKRLGLWT